ncbi:MAG: YegP family protein [Chitinophagaceae bacterium]
MGKFVIKKQSNGQFMFNLKAGNGEIILTSESYTAKASCEKGIESVKTNASDDSKYERKTSTNNKPFFVLKAGNGEPIGKSELYESTASMEKGIESVKKNAPEAAVEEV